MLDGAINSRAFLAYVRQVLAPAPRPGGAVAMDNLSSHKVPGVREAVEAAGATPLHLPPYSPDLNPIGTASAKLKALLRAEGPPAPSRRFGPPPAACWSASAQPSAPATPPTAATRSRGGSALAGC